jgi:hypothetical protein
MCVQITTGGRYLSGEYYSDGTYLSDTSSTTSETTSVSKDHVCFPLILVNPEFWEDSEDDVREWPLQLGAVCAIVGASIGAVVTLLLFSAICVHLSRSKILAIGICFLVSAGLSICSLVVGAFDLCHALGYEKDCSKRLRLEAGAVAEIFAAIFYILAAVFVFLFSAEIRKKGIPESEEDALAAEATQTMEEELAPLRRPSKAVDVPEALDAPPESA